MPGRRGSLRGGTPLDRLPWTAAGHSPLMGEKRGRPFLSLRERWAGSFVPGRRGSLRGRTPLDRLPWTAAGHSPLMGEKRGRLLPLPQGEVGRQLCAGSERVSSWRNPPRPSAVGGSRPLPPFLSLRERWAGSFVPGRRGSLRGGTPLDRLPKTAAGHSPLMGEKRGRLLPLPQGEVGRQLCAGSERVSSWRNPPSTVCRGRQPATPPFPLPQGEVGRQLCAGSERVSSWRNPPRPSAVDGSRPLPPDGGEERATLSSPSGRGGPAALCRVGEGLFVEEPPSTVCRRRQPATPP